MMQSSISCCIFDNASRNGERAAVRICQTAIKSKPELPPTSPSLLDVLLGNANSAVLK